MIRFPPTKILVPFDFTEVSVAAFRYAVALARRIKANVGLVDVEESFSSLEGGLFAPQLTHEARRRILRHLRSIVGR